ncbi:hypothetical protein T09_2022 [Trichinella sp. T9]|nr:hypothetical protein T09_2022 [Trichinella sp. T9]
MDFEALIKLQRLQQKKSNILNIQIPTDDNEDLIPSIIVDSVQSLQLEQLPYKKTKWKKSEVNNTLERFKDEVKFDEERYVVKLPWKTPEVRIPNNYEQAEQRLQQLEKRLNYNNERAKEYNEK